MLPAAALPLHEQDLYEAQMSVFLDPEDPVAVEASRQGIPTTGWRLLGGHRRTRWWSSIG